MKKDIDKFSLFRNVNMHARMQKKICKDKSNKNIIINAPLKKVFLKMVWGGTVLAKL